MIMIMIWIRNELDIQMFEIYMLPYIYIQKWQDLPLYDLKIQSILYLSIIQGKVDYLSGLVLPLQWLAIVEGSQSWLDLIYLELLQATAGDWWHKGGYLWKVERRITQCSHWNIGFQMQCYSGDMVVWDSYVPHQGLLGRVLCMYVCVEENLAPNSKGLSKIASGL